MDWQEAPGDALYVLYGRMHQKSTFGLEQMKTQTNQSTEEEAEEKAVREEKSREERTSGKVDAGAPTPRGVGGPEAPRPGASLGWVRL